MRDGIHSSLGGRHSMVTVSGTIVDIKNKLLAISAIVKHRKYSGWPPFQSDETWWYVTHPEKSFEGPCYVCLGFESQEEFRGDVIPSTFRDREQIDPLHLIRPRVHMSRPDLRGDCRCDLIWFNAVEVLAERLRREIEEVV